MSKVAKLPPPTPGKIPVRLLGGSPLTLITVTCIPSLVPPVYAAWTPWRILGGLYHLFQSPKPVGSCFESPTLVRVRVRQDAAHKYGLQCTFYFIVFVYSRVIEIFPLQCTFLLLILCINLWLICLMSCILLSSVSIIKVFSLYDIVLLLYCPYWSLYCLSYFSL